MNMQAWAMPEQSLQPHGVDDGEIRGSCYWYNQTFDATNPNHMEVDGRTSRYFVYVGPNYA